MESAYYLHHVCLFTASIGRISVKYIGGGAERSVRMAEEVQTLREHATKLRCSLLPVLFIC